MCTVLLLPGVNSIAVEKCIISHIYIYIYTHTNTRFHLFSIGTNLEHCGLKLFENGLERIIFGPKKKYVTPVLR